MDDIRDEGARVLLPESLKWRILITTRSETLGKNPDLKVRRRLDAFEPPESMALFRNVLVIFRRWRGRKWQGEMETWRQVDREARGCGGAKAPGW